MSCKLIYLLLDMAKIQKPNLLPNNLEGNWSKHGHLLTKKGDNNQILFISQKSTYRVLTFKNAEGDNCHLSRLFKTKDPFVYSMDDGEHYFKYIEHEDDVEIVKGSKKGSKKRGK